MNENKTNINWARRNLAKPTSNLHKMSVFAIRLFAYLDKEYKKIKQIHRKGVYNSIELKMITTSR